MSSEQEWPPLPPLSTAPCGCCPRHGQGHLFSGFLKLRSRREAGRLDCSNADPADGPAFFLTCFVGIPTVLLALGIGTKIEPPCWMHLVTTLPFLLLACIPPLRPLKHWLVASQCFRKAGEARFGTAAPTQPSAAPPADKDPRST
ncbi:DUF983 domain-containing protein (plasmid) [Azospirillum brasilense]|uniref:DUF983 domain-containing protein n=1 Tax=Azospirillum brasilense TaxID=192 RepID=A0A4D8RD61_AZOBR|nr:DUF983 domain-containing protein [Azospirillum brasilense]QCO19310.1 DUF983 domain-containing protein [Azospirillum brasilense]QCO19831.1 DUF983 domain-containing protein [Azospirillum brasilense]